MSRATESEHANQRADGAGAAHAPDLDAEHDPAVSRRASLAGLRREAAAPAGAAAQREVAEQHRAAGTSSVFAVRAALKLTVARINGFAIAIKSLLDQRPPSAAAAARHIEGLLEMFAAVGLELDRMTGEVSALSAAARGSLYPEVQLVAGAVHRIATLWVGAQRFAREHGDPDRVAAKNPYHLSQRVHLLYQYVGLEPSAPADQRQQRRARRQVRAARRRVRRRAREDRPGG